MKYAVTNLSFRKHHFNYFEIVMPTGVSGRYVYTYLIAGGDIYIRELEVFAPFNYG